MHRRRRHYGHRDIIFGKIRLPCLRIHYSESNPACSRLTRPTGALPPVMAWEYPVYGPSVIPDESKTIADGAVEPWSKTFAKYYLSALQDVCAAFKCDIYTPWKDLPEKLKDVILCGSGDAPIAFHYGEGKRSYSDDKPFEGVIPNLERKFRETDSAMMVEEYSKYQSSAECESCHGAVI